MRKNSKANNIYFIIVVLFSLFWGFPLFIILLNSVKPWTEISKNLFTLPTLETIQFEMYIETWQKFDFPLIINNTTMYTLTAVIGTCLFGSMAAYWLARNKSKFSNILLLLSIIPIMVPLQIYMVSLASLFSLIGLLGTRIGYVTVLTGRLLPLAIFMIHGFIKNVPIELEESAFIDGASRTRTFFSIIVPLIVPIVTTVAVISIFSGWNDLIISIIMMGGKPNMVNIQNALYNGFSTQSSDWPHALPGIVMATLPNIIFFVIMQKYIVKGMTEGAIKG